MAKHGNNETLFYCVLTSLFAILLLSVSGCSLLPGSDEPKEAPEPIGKFSSEGNEPRVSLKLFAGSNVNLSQYGDPLALLVKLYVLKDKNAFEQADYDTFLDDDRAREVVRSIYDGIDAPVVLTDPASAETIKYVANAFLVTKLSFANAVAAVCEGVGADIDDVVLALGYDTRIGASHLRPGPGWGGSCFPKDSRALIHQAGQAGYDFRFLDSAIEVNRQQFDRIVDKVRQAVGGDLDGRAVAVWGLTFKAGTDDLRDSPALEIVDRLLAAGASVRAHDPTVPVRRGPVPDDVVLADDAVGACAGADVLLVLTEWPEYAAVAPADALTAMVGRAVVDARNLLDSGPWRDLGVAFQGIGR